MNIERPELVIEARSVSRGIAIGRVVCLSGDKRQYFKVKISPANLEREVKRFQRALKSARRELKKLSEKGGRHASSSLPYIFDTHTLMLEDSGLISQIEVAIRELHVNAEWAVRLVSGKYLAAYKNIDDEKLRERYIDLEDVSLRLLKSLSGSRSRPFALKKDSILAAGEISPSTLVEMKGPGLAGIVAENGGWTSHSFILAREMNIPAVTGVRAFLRKAKNGDRIILDGYLGKVILNPTKGTIARYKAAETMHSQATAFLPKEPARGKLKTLDGLEITIRANLDISNDYSEARAAGAEGIGLYRSEYLLNIYQRIPGHREQLASYREIGSKTGDAPANIRVFDVGIRQLSGEAERNPALGLRAIRLGLSNEKFFQTQISALLQASYGCNIRIVLPMISDLSEIEKAKGIIDAEKLRLDRRGIRHGDPLLGVMIEVPAAVFMAGEIASCVDFICLGTNDLVQYMLAVDRDNESVASWFRTLHPAVLRAIKAVCEAGEKASCPVTICGEMAGSPVYAPVLIGLGARDLSMNAIAIPQIRAVVSLIAEEEAREIASGLLLCKTAEEAERRAGAGFSSKWSHLFRPEMLPG